MHWERGKEKVVNSADNHFETPTDPDPTPLTLRRMARQERATRQNVTIAARPAIGRGIARILHYAIDAARPGINPINVPWKIKGPRAERAHRREAKEKESMKSVLVKPRQPNQEGC